jgi:hypothetical protein
MDRNTIQARLNHGLSIVGGLLGTSFEQYRPSLALQPLGASIGSLQGAVANLPGYSLGRPAGFGEAVRIWMGDGSGLQVGDVLVGDGQTVFVAETRSLQPVLLIDCNTTLQFSIWSASGAYGGGSEIATATGWPASLRLHGRGGADPAALPSDSRTAEWEVLLPAIPGVVLHEDMRMIDTDLRRFVLAGVERTALGYRLIASYSGS